MHEDPFVRISTGNGGVRHAAKENWPNEALCGRPLKPEPVTPKGRKRCDHCQTSFTLMSKT
jgi:hypothetical protein